MENRDGTEGGRSYLEETSLNGYENEEKESKKAKLIRMIRNEKYQLFLFFFLFVLFVPVLMYYFMTPRGMDGQQFTCLMNNTFRVPCGRVNLTREECQKIECCFDDDNSECFHYLPSKYNYRRDEDGDGENDIFTSTRKVTPFGNNSTQKLFLRTTTEDDYTLKITVSKNNIPGDTGENNTSEIFQKILNQEGLLNVLVRRKINGSLLLTTELGPLIFSKNYTEWSFFIGEHLFGLDELYFTNNETKKTFIYKNRNDNLVLPAFMAYNNGTYHGLVIQNTSPMEIMVLPSKLIVVRSLGSDDISVILTVGLTPKDVMMRQRNFTFKMPPDWILRPQICR